MLTIIQLGCDWFSRLRTAGSHGHARRRRRHGHDHRIADRRLRRAPAALSSRSSGYCERCTLPLKLGGLSGWPASRAGSAGLCLLRGQPGGLFWRGCVALLKAGAPPKLIFFSSDHGFSFAFLVMSRFRRFQVSGRLMRVSRDSFPGIVFLWGIHTQTGGSSWWAIDCAYTKSMVAGSIPAAGTCIFFCPGPRPPGL